jgi:hypothetical protein
LARVCIYICVSGPRQARSLTQRAETSHIDSLIASIVGVFWCFARISTVFEILAELSQKTSIFAISAAIWPVDHLILFQLS